MKTARASLRLPFFLTGARTRSAGRCYLDVAGPRSRRASADGDLLTQYRVAAMTLRAHEDKTYRGANIASLTVPWGQAINADEAGVGGYHLVWARDLYQVSTAQIAIGDTRRRRALAGLPLRRPAEARRLVPAELAARRHAVLGLAATRRGRVPDRARVAARPQRRATYARPRQARRGLHRRAAARPRRRSAGRRRAATRRRTIAAEIAGLTAAAVARAAQRRRDLRRALPGRRRRVAAARRGRGRSPRPARTATAATSSASTTTATRTTATRSTSTTAAGTWDERSIVDAGFLDLVRLGVKRADDPFVTALAARGRRGDPRTRRTGRLLPLQPRRLRREGRRLALRRDRRRAAVAAADRRARRVRAGRRARRGLAPADDGRDRQRGLDDPRAGLGPARRVRLPSSARARARATPLAWSMARLPAAGRSRSTPGRPVETPSVVADRYARGTLPAGAVADRHVARPTARRPTRRPSTVGGHDERAATSTSTRAGTTSRGSPAARSA